MLPNAYQPHVLELQHKEWDERRRLDTRGLRKARALCRR